MLSAIRLVREATSWDQLSALLTLRVLRTVIHPSHLLALSTTIRTHSSAPASSPKQATLASPMRIPIVPLGHSRLLRQLLWPHPRLHPHHLQSDSALPGALEVEVYSTFRMSSTAIHGVEVTKCLRALLNPTSRLVFRPAIHLRPLAVVQALASLSISSGPMGFVSAIASLMVPHLPIRM